MPQTFEQYQLILVLLQQLATHEQAAVFLRQILRQFEHVLLVELATPLISQQMRVNKTFRSTSIINFSSMMVFYQFRKLRVQHLMVD